MRLILNKLLIQKQKPMVRSLRRAFMPLQTLGHLAGCFLNCLSHPDFFSFGAWGSTHQLSKSKYFPQNYSCDILGSCDVTHIGPCDITGQCAIKRIAPCDILVLCDIAPFLYQQLCGKILNFTYSGANVRFKGNCMSNIPPFFFLFGKTQTYSHKRTIIYAHILISTNGCRLYWNRHIKKNTLSMTSTCPLLPFFNLFGFLRKHLKWVFVERNNKGETVKKIKLKEEIKKKKKKSTDIWISL